ncbi:MAG: hypothetical protein U0X87_16550 [Anaerolineales bacterium]
MAGSEEQKKEYLPKIVAGEWSPFTAALIEYAFDFDPNELRTTARLQGGKLHSQRREGVCPVCEGAESILVYANLDGQSQASLSSGKRRKGCPSAKSARS